MELKQDLVLDIDRKILLPSLGYKELSYEHILKQMNHLIDKGDLSDDEQDFLTLLGTLVMAYEEEHYPDEQFELRGLALLRALIAEEELQNEDLLAMFEHQDRVDAILNGAHTLTDQQIEKIAAFFDLPAELFEELPT